MKKTALALYLLPFCLSLEAAEPPKADPAPRPQLTVLKAARLFDGRGDGLVTGAAVVVTDGRITSAGPAGPIPEGARVIDLGDATLLPGFIDAHVHLTGESGDNWYADVVNGLRRGVPEQAIRATEYARNTLRAGFTTVRNVGAGDYVDVGLRNSIDAGVVPGPRMLVSVHALGSRGGHCDTNGFPYMLFGKEPGFVEGIASGPDAFREAVRTQKKYGANLIKVCATGGVLSLGDDVDAPQVTQAEMDAIVDEAHRLRLKTAAHAHGAEGARAAVRAGIDSIEHGSFLDEDVLRLMKEKGTYLVPTLMAGEYAAGRSARRTYPPEVAAKAKAAVEARSAAFRTALRLGVKIAFGTDSGVSPHGRNAEEFALLVEHGMTPAAALRTATTNAADLLGISKKTGALEPGLAADIVAVPGNPLADIKVTERVLFVMKEGKVFRSPGDGDAR